MYSKEELKAEIIASDTFLFFFFNVHFKMKHFSKYDLPDFWFFGLVCWVFLFVPGNLVGQLDSIVQFK